MKNNLVLVTIFWLGLTSCTVPKESRLLKRTTKDWRESSVVLEAYADSPLSGSFLTLRENGKFEYTSSGLLISFDAGTWTNVEDTLTLSYVDSDQTLQSTQKVIIDRTTSTLIFEGDGSPAMFRLKITLNRL